jgi:hypothetical protein
MNNSWKIILIVSIAVIFSLLMGYRSNSPFVWSRALIAAIAFGFLGWLISYLSARRK